MSTIRNITLVTPAPLVPAAAGIAHPHGLARSTAEDWTQLHVALLPIFPLLTVGLLVPLWHRPRPDLAGFATVVAWAGAFIYAAFYTGLDAVAGIAAGTAVEHAPGTASLGPIKHPLYKMGESLGQAGAYTLIGAVLAKAVALPLRLFISSAKAVRARPPGRVQDSGRGLPCREVTGRRPAAAPRRAVRETCSTLSYAAGGAPRLVP